jgi:hypothetical protein
MAALATAGSTLPILQGRPPLQQTAANKDTTGGGRFSPSEPLLYFHDFMYVAESQNARVIKYQSFGDQWCSSFFMSQDPVAIDSMALDFIRNEPRAEECCGNPDNYLHEAAPAQKATFGNILRSQPRTQAGHEPGCPRTLEQCPRQAIFREPGKTRGH